MILSGYADFQYAQEALRQGCIDYLPKPVTRESLESTLGKASLALQKYYELEEDTSMAGKDSPGNRGLRGSLYPPITTWTILTSRIFLPVWASALRISQSCSTDTWETHR